MSIVPGRVFRGAKRATFPFSSPSRLEIKTRTREGWFTRVSHQQRLKSAKSRLHPAIRFLHLWQKISRRCNQNGVTLPDSRVLFLRDSSIRLLRLSKHLLKFDTRLHKSAFVFLSLSSVPRNKCWAYEDFKHGYDFSSPLNRRMFEIFWATYYIKDYKVIFHLGVS